MKSNPKQELRVHIRWILRRDWIEVMDIEFDSFEFPWLEEDFIHCLRRRNVIGLIAEHDERVVAFTVYALNKTQLHILKLAVAPEFRRQGIGSQITRKLIGKLSVRRRNRIVLEVRETATAAQLFWKHCGFRAVAVVQDFYDNTTDDAYKMRYDYREA